ASRPGSGSSRSSGIHGGMAGPRAGGGGLRRWRRADQGIGEEEMTFSVRQFGNLASQFPTAASQEGYFVVSTDGQRPAVLPPTQWATNDPKLVKWLKDASNLAKQAFLDGLTREFGHEIADVLQMYLPDEGTPLSSRDVKDIIGIGEMYR